MKVEKIHRVEPSSRIEGRDLTEKKFDSTLEEKRRQFQKRLQQDAKKKNGEKYDRKKATVEADTARLAVEMRIKRIDSEEQQK